MRIIITGQSSYIGTNLQKWFYKCDASKYEIEQIDVKNDLWKSFSWSDVDVVIHVAGIVHKPSLNDWGVYERVNVRLPVEVAYKAKKEGVSQFVFISSMAVYGKEKSLGGQGIINKDTIPVPKGMYGKSKYMAELKLLDMSNDSFRVTIIRPPNVYGKNCRGGYISGFSKIAKILPVIPCAYENIKQSMIYIDNLSELCRLLIENRISGIFTPQDEKSVSAVELMQTISMAQGYKKKESKILGIFVHIFKFLPVVVKAYGGICYCKEITEFQGIDYKVVSFEEGIRRTIR